MHFSGSILDFAFCWNFFRAEKQAHLPTKTTALEHAKEHPKGTFHAQENPFTVLVMLCMQCANQPFVEVCH